MQPIKTSYQTEIGAVVHDELDAWPEARPQFASLIEHAPGAARLIAVLEQGTARSHQSVRRRKHSGSIRKASRIKNRVEPWKLQHKVSPCTISCAVGDAASRVFTIMSLSWPEISR